MSDPVVRKLIGLSVPASLIFGVIFGEQVFDTRSSIVFGIFGARRRREMGEDRWWTDPNVMWPFYAMVGMPLAMAALVTAIYGIGYAIVGLAWVSEQIGVPARLSFVAVWLVGAAGAVAWNVRKRRQP